MAFAKVVFELFLISKVVNFSFRMDILQSMVQKNVISVILGLLKIPVFSARPRDLQGVGHNF